MPGCRNLFHPLPEHAAPPHDVRDFCLIPVNFDCARPKKIRRRIQIQKIRFHVFSSIEFQKRSCPCGADTPVRVPLQTGPRRPVVILSEARTSRSEVPAESKDPYSLPAVRKVSSTQRKRTRSLAPQ